MRGESKYHYVDLSLIDDQQGNLVDTEQVQIPRDTSVPLERPSLKRYVKQIPCCFLRESTRMKGLLYTDTGPNRQQTAPHFLFLTSRFPLPRGPKTNDKRQ